MNEEIRDEKTREAIEAATFRRLDRFYLNLIRFGWVQPHCSASHSRQGSDGTRASEVSGQRVSTRAKSNQLKMEAVWLRISNRVPMFKISTFMNLAGFCRNCLAKWYLAAAAEQGVELDYEDTREMIDGMPYAEWKSSYQT